MFANVGIVAKDDVVAEFPKSFDNHHVLLSNDRGRVDFMKYFETAPVILVHGPAGRSKARFVPI